MDLSFSNLILFPKVGHMISICVFTSYSHPRSYILKLLLLSIIFIIRSLYKRVKKKKMVGDAFFAALLNWHMCFRCLLVILAIYQEQQNILSELVIKPLVSSMLMGWAQMGLEQAFYEWRYGGCIVGPCGQKLQDNGLYCCEQPKGI